jgi:hypothetical protein
MINTARVRMLIRLSLFATASLAVLAGLAMLDSRLGLVAFDNAFL